MIRSRRLLQVVISKRYYTSSNYNHNIKIDTETINDSILNNSIHSMSQQNNNNSNNNNNNNNYNNSGIMIKEKEEIQLEDLKEEIENENENDNDINNDNKENLKDFNFTNEDFQSNEKIKVNELTDYFENEKFKANVQIPRRTLDSKYRKYAQMVKSGIEIEAIKKEAINDSISLSTEFYNTLIYIYLLKLESLKDEKEILQTETIVESIFKDISTPDNVTMLLNTYTIVKHSPDRESMIKGINGLLSGPDSLSFCQEAFQMLLQILYNFKDYKMVISIYKELFGLQESLFSKSADNINPLWNSGIILHSMAMLEEMDSTDMSLIMSKAKLTYSKSTQFHFNCLASKYLSEGLIIEAWLLLKEFYLRGLKFSKSIPLSIIQILKSSEDYELAVQMAPLLLSILTQDLHSFPTSSTFESSLSSIGDLRQLLVDGGEISQNLIPSENNPLFNPFSSQYILSKHSIQSIEINPTFSLFGVKAPQVPKHRRISGSERVTKQVLKEIENEHEYKVIKENFKNKIK
ncbi:hypothetical protein ACTFIY_009421 [Dictyostelium cf. discoideum]